MRQPVLRSLRVRQMPVQWWLGQLAARRVPARLIWQLHAGVLLLRLQAPRHRWATETGRNVLRAFVVVLLGDGTGPKCSPSVLRYTVGRRNGAEMFPERAARCHWATELDLSVAQA